MRFALFSLFIATLAANASSFAADIVYSKFRDNDSFKRISEYFTGDEDPGRYAITRTHPDNRSGHYISLKVAATDQTDRWSAIRLRVIRPGNPEERQYSLPIEVGGKDRVLIGLTGSYWSTGDAAPLAWKAEMLDSNGNPVASAQSFLWSTR